MTSTENVVWPRDGYSPEWLALEDASGGRYQMTGNLDVDTPLYDMIFSGMSKQWPQFEEELDVWDENTDDSCQKTKVRVYRPKQTAIDKLPLMIYFHGGGFVAGNLDTEDAQCRYLAAKMACLVISVDYPKMTKSGSVNLDVLNSQYGIPSIQWCRQRASALGIDTPQTVLCGGSAGAMFAAEIIHHYCIEKGDKSSIAGAILWYPCLLPPSYSEDGKHKEMYKSWNTYINGKVPVISEDVQKAIWSLYDSDYDSPRHFPARAKDLSNWPPTYIAYAEKDIFRDDSRVFHKLLDDAGVPNKIDFYDGLPHWFHTFPMLQMAHTMMEKTLDGFRFVLESSKISQ